MKGLILYFNKKLKTAASDNIMRIGIFFFYLIVVYVCYHPIFKQDFQSDDNSFVLRYNTIDFFELLKHNFGDNAFTPLHHICGYLLCQLFAYNPLPHHLVSILLHVMNAYLLFKILSHSELQVKNKVSYAFSVSLLFLISPYQTEAVNWIAGRTYLLSVFFMLLSFTYYIKFKRTSKKLPLYISLLFYSASLFSKEIALVFPLMLLVMELFYKKKFQSQNRVYLSMYFILIGIYWLIRMQMLHFLVGGYGKAVHLNFSPQLIVYTTTAYLLKFFTLYRYLSFAGKSAIMIMSLIILILVYTGYKGKEHKNNRKRILNLFVIFFISLLPVINLETSFLGDIQSDRYGYAASILVSIIYAECIYTLCTQKYAAYIVSILVIVFGYFTCITMQYWVEAGAISQNFIRTFNSDKTEKNKDVYVLNLPDNYKGVYLFRNSFKEFLVIHCPGTDTANIHIPAMQHIGCTNDSVKFQLKNDTLIFQLLNKTSYFMKYRNNKTIEYLQTERYQYKIRFINNPEKPSVYYFNKGHLQKMGIRN